jgi:hypothetical protein
MGGQDGFARALVAYTIDSDILMAGLTLKPSERFKLGLRLGYTVSEAGMDPFDIADQAADFVSTHPATQYDFSQVHTYSDLDTTRIDATFKMDYSFADDLWAMFMYRYSDFADDAPYMYDTSGTFDWVSVGVGWNF